MISENLYEIRWFRRKNWRQNISMVLTVMRGFPEKEHPKYDVPRIDKYYALLGERPEVVNEQPYGEGWLVLVEVADPAALEGLMDAAAYRAFVEQQTD